MLPLAAIERTGAVVRDDGSLIRVLALDLPREAAIGASAAAATRRRIVRILEQIALSTGPISLHIEAVGSPSGVRELGSAAVETHLVCTTHHLGRRARRAPRSVGHASVESSAYVDALARAFGRIGVAARVVDGVELTYLILRRIAPLARAPQPVRPLEVVGTIDPAADLRTGARVARELRTELELCAALDPRHVELDGDLEHIYEITGVSQTSAQGLLEPLIESGTMFTLSLHLTAARPEDRADEGESGVLYGAGYLALRVPGGEDAVERLLDAHQRVCGRLAEIGGLLLRRGDFRQAELWPATLPIGGRVSDTTPSAAQELAASIPLLPGACGSPSGVPIGRSALGTVERLDPWDSRHRTAGMLMVIGPAGSGAHVLAALRRGLSLHGARTVTIATGAPPADFPGELSAVPTSLSPNPWWTDPSVDDLRTRARLLRGVYELALRLQRHPLAAKESSILAEAVESVLRAGLDSDSSPNGRALLELLSPKPSARADIPHQASAELWRRLARLGSAPGFEWLLGEERGPRCDADWIVCDPELGELLPVVLWAAADEAARSLAAARRHGVIERGAVVLDACESLLAHPPCAAWLARLARQARRLGLCAVAVCRDPGVLARSHALSAARVFSIVTVDADIARRHPTVLPSLGPGKVAEDPDTPLYWINGGRGIGALYPPHSKLPSVLPTLDAADGQETSLAANPASGTPDLVGADA